MNGITIAALIVGYLIGSAVMAVLVGKFIAAGQRRP